MKIRVKILLLFFVFLSFSSLAHGYTITATDVEDRNDFVLEPAKQEVFVDPGEKSTRYVSITSRVKTPTTFKVEIEDIIGSDNPDKPVVLLGGDRSPYSLKDYLHPDVKEFTLNFGEKIQIPISVDLPQDAAPGGFYAALIISNAPSKMAATSTGLAETNVISRVASLFFVRINGPADQKGELTDFKIKNSQPIYQNGNLTFQIYFKNTGTVHLVPYGMIDVKNIWGQMLDQLPLDAYFSLPNSLRYREVAWTKPLAFGRYTATLRLHRGYGETVDEKTIAFWIVPYKILVTGLVLIIFLVGLIYFLSRKFELKRKK